MVHRIGVPLQRALDLAGCQVPHGASVWDLASGEVKSTLQGHTHGVLSMAFSPDGRLLRQCGESLFVDC